ASPSPSATSAGSCVMNELSLARPKAIAAPAPAGKPLQIGPILRVGVLLIVAAVVLVPLLATALGGLRDLGDLRANAFGVPKAWLWGNYWDILASARYWRLLGN